MEQNENTPDVAFIGALTKQERRVLGVLVEKALTTPEYYPLTMKALVTGCNQKNNRAPLTNYDEFELEDTINQLQQRGLVATVQTAGGRTERYRHLLRDTAGWSNRQLAIMGELLLRGRQQVGELRTRASRMTSLDSLDELREELERLMQAGYVQSTGDLQRRGIEIDHALYRAEENKTLERHTGDEPDEPAPVASGHSISSRASQSTVSSFQPSPVVPTPSLEELQELRDQLAALTDRVSELERQLGL